MAQDTIEYYPESFVVKQGVMNVPPKLIANDEIDANLRSYLSVHK